MTESFTPSPPHSIPGIPNKVRASCIPAHSATQALLAFADYADAYEVPVASDLPTALHAYLVVTARTPRWIDALMTVRNTVVRLLGLKDVGRLADIPPVGAANDLKPGNRIGIFTIRSLCEREVILDIIDTHLDVVVSVYKHEDEPARVTVSTLVFYHKLLGRLYMLPVAPMHRIVVRAILSKSLRR